MKYRSISRWSLALAAALVVIIPVYSQPKPGRVILGGRAVTLVADAVYAFPSARSRVLAVGGTDQGLGTFLQELDPGFPAKPVLDRNAAAEVYASYKPDLAIFKSSLRKGVGGALEALGIRVQYLDLETPEDYYRDLENLGKLFSDEARAAELIVYYKGIVEKISQDASKSALKPRILVLQAAGDSFEVPPDSWMQTRIVRMAGGTPVWPGANPGQGWAKVGFEQIAAWNPDMILVINYREGVEAVVGRMKADSRFALLKAGRREPSRAFRRTS